MTKLKSHLWLAVVVLACTAWPVRAQEPDKVLEIQRYPDEPLQLVELRVGDKSVKDDIKLKFKSPSSKWGLDSVKFEEKDDWVKRVSITVRNASDKPVYGVQGFLFFQPRGFPTLFSVQLTNSKALNQNPLKPGEEIELTVDPAMLNQTLENIKAHGAEVSGAGVSFSLDTVWFSKDSQWHRGKLLHPDSAVPGKWVPVQ
jgi:hypothetical protein